MPASRLAAYVRGEAIIALAVFACTAYTNERGLSIMPDYRYDLTVGELIDLVAYLRTLQAKPNAPGAGS